MFIRLLTASIFLFSLASCSNNESDITILVLKWNELHNTQNTEQFKDLYAEDVLFYGSQSPAAACIEKKKKFLTQHFNQEIISPIAISYYSSGQIRCDFTKRTFINKKVREHFSYILCKKIDDKYLITGESDLITDENKKVNLDLGDKELSPATRSNIYLVIAIVLIIAGVIIGVGLKNKKKLALIKNTGLAEKAIPLQNKSIEPEPKENAPQTDAQFVSKVKEVIAEMNLKISNESPEHQKGTTFEKYIVEKFNQGYFKLIEWRSDKFHKGIYAASNKLPDLEYSFELFNCKTPFAVECKWRAGFVNEKIEWAKLYQISNYKNYQKQKSIKVFVIIGVGGEASNPESLYAVPLSKINSIFLFKNELEKYRRKPDHNFYLNVEQMELY